MCTQTKLGTRRLTTARPVTRKVGPSVYQDRNKTTCDDPTPAEQMRDRIAHALVFAQASERALREALELLDKTGASRDA